MFRTLRMPVRAAVLTLAITSAVAGFGAGNAHASTADPTIECDTGSGTIAVKPSMVSAASPSRSAKVKVTADITGCFGDRPQIVSGTVKISLSYPTNSCTAIIADTYHGRNPLTVPGSVKIVWRDGRGRRVAATTATGAVAGEDASVPQFFVLSINPSTGPFRNTFMVVLHAPAPNTVRTTCVTNAGFTGFSGFTGLI